MLINVFQILYIHLLDKTNIRNADMKCQIIIVELKKEGHATNSIQKNIHARNSSHVPKNKACH